MEEKINQILQSAIISICSQHYSEKLEVDGIVCISSQQTNLRHVVRIHQTVEPNNKHHGPMDSRDSSPAPAPNTAPHWVDQQRRMGMQGERTKSRKRSRNTEDSDPDFNCSISNSAENFPTIVKQLHKRKSRAQKINNYTEYDSEVSDSPDYGSDAQDGRYGVDDGRLGEEQLGSASVLLKLLAKPHKTSMLANTSKSTLANPSIEMVNLEGSVKTGMEYQIKLNDGSVTRKEVTPNEEIRAKSPPPVVKDEPIWDGEYGGMNPLEQNGVAAKDKKEDSGAALNADAAERNSILMKILEGKSLREAYKSEYGSSPRPESQSFEEKIKSEQENSLLYRLPFVSFQDLFPQNSQDILPNENNNSRKRIVGPKKPLTLQTLEYTKSSTGQGITNACTAMQKNQSEQKYSTRLSSGKKNPISYQEMLGAVSYSSEDEKDQGERDLDEESYIPQQSEYNNIAQEAEIVESEIKTGAKRRKMGPRCKVTGKRENSKAANGEEPVKPKPTVVCSNDRFECSICGRVFDNRALRDMHEDAERAEHFFKCPLCDGFFGSEESKLIHMQDRHGIATKEFAEERANKKISSAKNKSAGKRKESVLFKKVVTGQEDKEDLSEKGSENSSDSLVLDIKQEKTSENAIECDMCDMKFLGNLELKEHMQTFHGAQ